MKYSIYQLEFPAGVHFGNGMLNDSDYTFRSDMLFSALYIEALKLDKADCLYDAVKSGELLISDAFPYVDGHYMIPKPMLYVEPADRGNSEEKKKYKKLKYLPAECLDAFLKGRLDIGENPMAHYGVFDKQVMTAVRKDGDAQPYHVGTYYYYEGNGLYVIAAYKDKRILSLLEELLNALSYVGIGGKKSGGLGKFVYRRGDNTEILMTALTKESKRKMLLSSALPTEDEMECALEGASYLLEKRSGFIASDTYAEELRKKKDLYVFASGSCFVNDFHGDIYDVSDGGNHPVYRYAKPMFMGV